MTKQFKEGDLVECSFRSVYYPAKIVKSDHSKTTAPYFIHYQGWKKRWDEWVPASRFKFSGLHSDERSQKKESGSSKLKFSSFSGDEPTKKEIALNKKTSNRSTSKEKKPKSKQTVGLHRQKHRGRPPKRQSVASESKTDDESDTVLQETDTLSPQAKKNKSLSSPVSSVENEPATESALKSSSEFRKPSFERNVTATSVTYTSSDGKVLKNISEAKKYCTQKKLAFQEIDFDFTLPFSEHDTKSLSTTKKKSAQKKSIKKDTTLNKQDMDKLEEVLNVQQLQNEHLAEKSENKSKRKRGRPPKTSTTRGSKKETVSDQGSRADEPMEMEVSADISDSERKTVSSEGTKLEIPPTATVSEDLFPVESSTTFTSSTRPARSRKPNQRYNILLSELDAMVRQGRRRRYSSKHSTTSGDEAFHGAVETDASDDQPLLVKIGKRKESRSSKPSSSKRKKSEKVRSTTESGGEFDSAPEFVEIQARSQSPPEHDDGLPPVLGVSSDDGNLRSHCLDSSPLVDQMCDVLPTPSSMETSGMDRLISDCMRQFSTEEPLSTSDATNLIETEHKVEKKGERKPVSKKAAKQSLSVDDSTDFGSFKNVTKQTKPKKTKIQYPTEPQPSITNEEIEEGLQTLKDLEEQALRGIKVSSAPPPPQQLTSAVNISPRSSSSQVVLKIKSESRRGRSRRSANAEIPLLRRESEGSGEFNGSTGSQGHQQAPTDETVGYCYLPPEIMGDHCYGKSYPSTSGAAAVVSSTESRHVYNTEPTNATTSLPLPRTSRSRPVHFELLQRSPSPPPYKSSEGFLSDAEGVGAYAYHRLESDYGGSSGVVTSSNVSLSASIMTGGQVAMLSDKMPANILEDDSDLNEEITSVDIQ